MARIQTRAARLRSVGAGIFPLRFSSFQVGPARYNARQPDARVGGVNRTWRNPRWRSPDHAWPPRCDGMDQPTLGYKDSAMSSSGQTQTFLNDLHVVHRGARTGDPRALPLGDRTDRPCRHWGASSLAPRRGVRGRVSADASRQLCPRAASAAAAFLTALAERFGPDQKLLDQAVDDFRKNPGPPAARALHNASEPRRQELIRRLNLAPGDVRAGAHAGGASRSSRRPAGPEGGG